MACRPNPVLPDGLNHFQRTHSIDVGGLRGAAEAGVCEPLPPAPIGCARMLLRPVIVPGHRQAASGRASRGPDLDIEQRRMNS
jgi:hypothetical protein